MGKVWWDDNNKNYQVIASKNVSQAFESEVAPGLAKIHQALKEHGNNTGEPTIITLTIQGKTSTSFEIKVDDLRELQEILGFTIDQ
jgi:hypothetical protein